MFFELISFQSPHICRHLNILIDITIYSEYSQFFLLFIVYSDTLDIRYILMLCGIVNRSMDNWS